ncbi:gamma-glutamyltransferase family protein [Algihabitans albus]|uniref:gamma-glutamyltransferase family protein n=1 Tax=Algihabitans albus TaxID=2164067 RepID=UPI000E5C7E43|nr:gamma-glutamyltransferase [Algihabitans albus]
MTLTRPCVGATRHVVSAGHYLAASAAHDVLEGGGNAVDAGCAAGLALGVVQSDLVNIGGVAPIMVRMADSPTPITIDGLGVWPAGLPERHFLERHGGEIPLGVERIVVPAAIDAWVTALERFGTLRFADVAAAAIRYAREGIPAHPLLVDTITEQVEGYSRWDSNAAIYLPGGRVPKVGERFLQTDLACTLQFLCDEEAAAEGDRLTGLAAARAAFYTGDVARKIVRFVQAEGGFLALSDMAEFRCRVEPALATAWRGTTVFTCGPWCQGPALALALNQIEAAGLEGLGHNDAAYIHLLTEILNNAFADREYHFTDPRFGEVPLERLLSEAHARARLREIDPQCARAGMPAPILPLDGRVAAAPLSGDSPRPEPDTSYVAVVDAAGNAFSATPSDGSWTVPVVPGLGLVPSGRGSQSRPDPAHPAGVRAGKRPRLTPNPAMLVAGAADADVMPFGSPGGDVQTQAMLQVLLNRRHFGMDLQASIDAPRFATFNFPSSFAPFTHHAGLVKLEGRIDESVAEALRAKGHRIDRWPDFDWRAGGVCAVESDRGQGLVFGGADPRRPSYAIGG